MIVPEYWAEARQQVRRSGRSITVRRFGWSDVSQEAAQAHAEERAQAALDAILAGEDIPRREPRSNYGVHGVPIREQIVMRHDEVVVTRNSYGALCLNTPDVLFADVDYESKPAGCVLPLLACIAVAFAGLAAGTALHDWRGGIGAAVVALLLANGAWLVLKRLALRRDGGAEGRAMMRVERFVSENPVWHLRLYRTPAGLRVLAMHATFEPGDAEVARLFQALRVDPVYAVMCQVQHCFRARLTAKPWRIGIGRHIAPRRAAWSREQAMSTERLAWISAYETRAAGFAACRYLRSLGDEAQVHPTAARVRDLHDTASRANLDLPLA